MRILYTVVILNSGQYSYIRYACHPAYDILETELSDDQSKALNALKLKHAGEWRYLTPLAFAQQVEKLAAKHQKDLAKLETWNNGH